MKIAILGSRGIPASYSGFETCIEEISKKFVKQGINTTVYCRSSHYQLKINQFKNINLVYLPSIKTKHLDTISHTFLSILHLTMRKYNLIVLFGVGNAIFIPILRLFSIPVISVVDGNDWAREKWGIFTRTFLKACAYFSIRYSNYCVVDNIITVNWYQSKFNMIPELIPYGANTNVDLSKGDVLHKYNLAAQNYIIFIGRFVKEKGIEFLINNYSKTSTNMKLVIVGGNPLDKSYEKYLRSISDERIIFTGFIYGEKYEILLANAYMYVSCSFIEGTSPSLLNAMSLNGFALVSNLEENKEVLKGTCMTFKTQDSNDFREKLNYCLKSKKIVEKERYITKGVVRKYYNWDLVAQRYIEIFIKCIK